MRVGIALVALVALAPALAAQSSGPLALEVTTSDRPLAPGGEVRLWANVTADCARVGGRLAVLLALDDAPAWLDAAPEPSQVDLEGPCTGRARAPFALVLRADADAPAFESAELLLRAQAGNLAAEDVVPVQSGYASRLGLEATTGRVSVSIGDPETCRFRVTNVGNGATKVLFTTTPPGARWQAAPPNPVTLEPGASRDVEVLVARNEGEGPQEGTLTLRAEGAYANDPSLAAVPGTATCTATVKSGMPAPGALAAAAAAVVATGLTRRRGR